MPKYPTPEAAAVAAFTDGPATVRRTVVAGDFGAVIVTADGYEPPVAQVYYVHRVDGGWTAMGGGSVGGVGWTPVGDDGRGVAVFSAETTSDVEAVLVRLAGQLLKAEVVDGFGLGVLADVPSISEVPCYLEYVSYTTAAGHVVAGRHPSVPYRPADSQLLAALADARHWVWATQVQIERFVSAFRRQRFSSLPPTPEQRRETSQTFADAQFLLNAAAQVEKALGRLAGGPSLSGGLSKDIRTLRNLHEHWEQHRDSFASPTFAKARAGAVFATDHPDAVPWSFSFGSDGHFVSVLRLEDLWRELDGIDLELARRNNDLLAGTGIAHVPEDTTRPPRPMPVPAADPMLLGVAVVTQSVTVGAPGP